MNFKVLKIPPYIINIKEELHINFIFLMIYYFVSPIYLQIILRNLQILVTYLDGKSDPDTYQSTQSQFSA
jgi:hypothetical protein